MLLYKYRPWNTFTADLILNQRIYFPSKMRLNDPSELVHPVKFESSIMTDEFEQLRTHIDERTQLLALKIDEQLDFLTSAAADGHDVSESSLAPYLSIRDRHWRGVEAVFDRAETCSAFAYYALCLFEDATLLYDTQERIVTRLNEKLSMLGILSLSANCDSSVMWAHYANNHEGVVLVFDSSKDALLSTARPIEYVSERPVNSPSSIVANLFRKAQSWSYEDEYRVLSNSGDRLYNLTADAIAGVILGARMNREDREAARHAAERAGVSVYRAYPHPERYAICHEPQ